MPKHKHFTDIVARLQKHGDRITKSRLAVLEFLCAQQRPVNIKQIGRALPFINVVTLYRIIEHLISDGIVAPLTHDHKEQFFELASPYHQHHHHAICQRCGKVSDIHCELKLGKLKNFIPSMHVVTVYGWCKSCLNPQAA